MNNLITFLKELLSYLEYCNEMSPFPVYDTEYVKEVRNKLDLMQESRKEDYDGLPVAACKYCNDLFIIPDELENDICMRCGAVNEITIYKDIFEWLKMVNKSEQKEK